MVALSPGQTLIDFHKRYGDLFRLDLGNIPTIWLCSVGHLKEAYAKEEFSGRFFNEMPTFVETIKKGHRGTPLWSVGNGEGPLWSEQKKFMCRILAELGMGKRAFMQTIIEQSASELVDMLKKQQKLPIQNSKFFMLHTNGVIWRIVTGNTNGLDKDRLVDLTEKMLNVFRNLDPSAPTSLLQMNSLIFTKCLQYLGLPNFIDSHREIAEYLNTEVENSNADEEGNYVERALSYRENCIKSGKDNFLTGPDGRSYLTGHLIDLFFAGTETTSSTMEWVLLYVIKFRSCQERMYDEISMITDSNSRKIELADKPKAHYCNAFVTEVMRHCPIGSFSVPHKTVAKACLGNREIPKGTQVVFSNYVVHHDEMVFSNPFEFNPSRFLDADGSYLGDGDVYIFGPGRRRCPGEALARAEIFLFLTALVQQFRITARNPKSLTLKGVQRFVIYPEPFEFYVEDRVK